MRKIIEIVLVAVAALGLGFLIYRGVTERTNYNDYDLWSILDGDNVKGNRDAKVLIFEYADFQCPGCAKMWTKLEKVLARLGRFTPKNEPSEIQQRIETAMENISSVLLKYLGGGSIFEKLFRK